MEFLNFLGEKVVISPMDKNQRRGSLQSFEDSFEDFTQASCNVNVDLDFVRCESQQYSQQCTTIGIDESHPKCTYSATESETCKITKNNKDNEYLTILKTKPRGKKASEVVKYEQKCQQQIDQINRKMDAIANKKDKEWLKLRKQRIACEARLRNRRSEANKNSQLPMLNLMM